MVKLKICGIQTEAEVDAVNSITPDFIGFVFAESKRKITKKQAALLREKVKEGIIVVGVFSNQKRAEIIELVKENIIDYVQLHGDEDFEYIKKLREHINVPIIKAIRVTAHMNFPKMDVDYVLLDGSNPGSGVSFDWNHIGTIEQPFFLAGGLNADNVEEALRQVSPYAVDVSSGVEINGEKSIEKMRDFSMKVRNIKGVEVE